MVVSTGGTREAIDPVRFIGNRSSGRQGAAVALAAADRGAEVELVAAHVDAGVIDEAAAHPRINVSRVGSALELRDEVVALSDGADVVVMVAAVADYRVAEASDTKLSKKGDEGMTLHLVQNPDILAGLVADRAPGQTVVGFAAETAPTEEELLEKGRSKRRRKGVDLLAVNEVGWSKGFESGENLLVFLDAHDAVAARAQGSKREVAEALWDAVLAVRNS